jgi:uncharacterized membrane protein
MAQTPTPGIKGLYLLTDYPAVSVQPGAAATIPLKLQNYALIPESYALKVTGVPQGWTATLLGGGQPIAAAMPATDQNVSLQLRLDVPAGANMAQAQTITVAAEGGSNQATLPLTVSLIKELPAKLTVKPQLSALRGGPKSSFDYTLSIKNDSGRNLTVSFTATAPRNFEASFTEAYGSQEISSVPVDAGASKDIKLKVRPPSTADAGQYPVSVTVASEGTTAKSDLTMEIAGAPRLSLTGRQGLVSTQAEAGAPTTLSVIVTNDGSAPADAIELAGTAPNGWKIDFEPKAIDRLGPSENREVQANITPSEKTLVGDYMTTLRATSRGEASSQQFRVTVSTSTRWGLAAAGVIGAALLLMVGAVARFGRR